MNLNERNTLTFDVALRTLTTKVMEQQQRIDGLVNTMGTVMKRMDLLGQLVTDHKAATTGHGPTVK